METGGLKKLTHISPRCKPWVNYLSSEQSTLKGGRILRNAFCCVAPSGLCLHTSLIQTRPLQAGLIYDALSGLQRYGLQSAFHEITIQKENSKSRSSQAG